MNQPILTTQKSNTQYRITNTIISVVFGVLLISLCLYTSSITWGESSRKLASLSDLVFVITLVEVCLNAYFTTSYADVFEHKITGKGIQGFKVLSFDLSFDQITNITYQNINLYIETANGKFKIIANAEKAKKIFDYYIERRSTIQQESK